MQYLEGSMLNIPLSNDMYLKLEHMFKDEQ